MMYHVAFSDQAKKTLWKMDKHEAMLILGWIRKHLENCADPRQHGKPLVATHRCKWRYRVGEYRILANIMADIVLILVVAIGHRQDIYKDKK